ncbi:MAG: glycosyltransferase family 4 protein [Bacillota bacterium]
MPLKVNLKLENFVGKGNGVYSAYLTELTSLERYGDVILNRCTDEECNVIHYHSLGFGYARSSIAHRTKIVITAHVVPDSFNGSLIFSRYWHKSAREYLRWAYQQAQIVIAVSPQVENDLRELGITRQIKVLPNSVDHTVFKFDPASRRRYRQLWGFHPQDFIILGVGQIQPRKGITDFVETARRLPEYHFVWAGGRPYGKLTADFYSLNLIIENAPANVHFIGQMEIKEMPGLYAAADVYFLPSYHENFALATIEAASVGLPLVLRDLNAYRNSLHDCYLAGSNAGDFTKLLMKLRDKRFFEQWQASSKTLAFRYGIESHCRELYRIYEEIAVRNRTGARPRRKWVSAV